MPLRVVPSYSRLPSKRCPSIGFLSRADREIGVFQQVAPPTKLRIEFPHETGLILSCAGKVGPPCRQSRGIDPPVTIRRGEEIHLSNITRVPRQVQLGNASIFSHPSVAEKCPSAYFLERGHLLNFRQAKIHLRCKAISSF